MPSILAGTPLPDIKSQTTNATVAPDWYNTYMKDIAEAGTNQMNMDPTKMIAPQSSLTTTAIKDAPSALTAYQAPLAAAQLTAGTAAQGVGPTQISNFMNPYTQNVVSGMANLSQQNTNDVIMPSLLAAAGGSGNFGSARAQNAAAEALARIQSGLTGQQAGALQTGYQNATTSALQNASLQNQAAQTQGQLAATEGTQGANYLNNMNSLGALDQAYNQSIINAPMTTATNAANALSTLKVPSTTTTNYVGPGQSGQYSTSPLGAITGLGALFASGAGGSSPAAGIGKALGNVGGYLGGLFSTPSGSEMTTLNQDAINNLINGNVM